MLFEWFLNAYVTDVDPEELEYDYESNASRRLTRQW